MSEQLSLLDTHWDEEGKYTHIQSFGDLFAEPEVLSLIGAYCRARWENYPKGSSARYDQIRAMYPKSGLPSSSVARKWFGRWRAFTDATGI